MSVKVINRKCPQETLEGAWDQKGTAVSKVAQGELWLGPIGKLWRESRQLPQSGPASHHIYAVHPSVRD